MTRAKPHRNLNRLLLGEILRRWQQLTISEIDECGADRSRLVKLLRARYGYAERRAEKEVELFFGEFETRLRMAV